MLEITLEELKELPCDKRKAEKLRDTLNEYVKYYYEDRE